jgi:hypothetical protein
VFDSAQGARSALLKADAGDPAFAGMTGVCGALLHEADGPHLAHLPLDPVLDLELLEERLRRERRREDLHLRFTAAKSPGD